LRALALGLYAVGLCVGIARLRLLLTPDTALPLRLGVDFASWYCVFAIQIFLSVTLFRLMGFDLPSGFKFPFLSRSFADFFRRWNHYVRDAVLTLFYLPMMQRLRKCANDRTAHLIAGYTAILIGSFVLNDLLVPVATSAEPLSAARKELSETAKHIWFVVYWTGVVWPTAALQKPEARLGTRDRRRAVFEVVRFFIVSMAIWVAVQILYYRANRP
jgi:hypothetical protein